jgi:uncharacterized protein (TIGR02145 family)
MKALDLCKSLAAGIMLAMVFTFISCSSGGDDDGGGGNNNGGNSNGDGSLTYQGKTYKTVKIGNQTWMAENLDYNVGDSMCFDNDPTNCAKYGRLYDWETAISVCPSGWHLPSNADWDKLMRYVDGTSGTESPCNSPTAGKYLKATNGWNSGGNGTDDYGFSALPGGHYSGDYFLAVGYFGNWWSASEYNSNNAYYRQMIYSYESANYAIIFKNVLLSVRCVRD